MAASHPRFDPADLLRQTDWIRQLAFRLVGDETRAEDLVQDTMVAALAAPPGETRSVRQWLSGVTRNLARKEHRSSQRRVQRESRAAGENASPPVSDIVERAEAHRRVTNAVLDLPEPYRTALLLRFFQDLSPKAIARQLGQPDATVRSHVKRGLELLQVRMAAIYGSDWKALCLAPLLSLPPAGVLPGATGTGGEGGLGPGLLTAGGAVMATKWKLAALGAVVLGSTLWLAQPSDSDPLGAPERGIQAAAADVRAAAPALAGEQPVERRALESGGGQLTAVATNDFTLESPGRSAFMQMKGVGFEGRVVTPDGRAVPDGTVVRSFRLHEDEWRGPYGEWSVSGPEGAFAVPPGTEGAVYSDLGDDLLQERFDASLPVVTSDEPQTWRLAAETPDGVTGYVDGIVLAAGEMASDLQVPLEDVPLFRGRVVDALSLSQGIAGARLSLWSGATGPLSRKADQFDFQADEDGNFAVRIQPGEVATALTASAQGFGMWWSQPEDAGQLANGGFMEVRMARGARVHGVALEPDGSPVEEGTLVRWIPDASAADLHATRWTSRTVETQAGGLFELADLPPVAASVGLVRSAERQTESFSMIVAESLEAENKIELYSGQSLELMLQRTPLMTIEGNLALNRADGPPEGSWIVEFRAKDGRLLAAEPVAEDGTFKLHTDSDEEGRLIAKRVSPAASFIFLQDLMLTRIDSALATHEIAAATIDIAGDGEAGMLLRIGGLQSAEEPGDEAASPPSAFNNLIDTDLAGDAAWLETGTHSITYGFSQPEVEPIGFAALDDKLRPPATGITVPVHDTRIAFQAPVVEFPHGTVGWIELPAAATRKNWGFFFRKPQVPLPLTQLDELALQGLPPGSYGVRVRTVDGKEAAWTFTLAERDSIAISLDDWIRRLR